MSHGGGAEGTAPFFVKMFQRFHEAVMKRGLVKKYVDNLYGACLDSGVDDLLMSKEETPEHWKH